MSDAPIIIVKKENVPDGIKNLIELLDNMKDLDPEYSKTVDAHFWSLA